MSETFITIGTVHLEVVSNGARRSRRFDVARSPALAEFSKVLGLLTPRRPEGLVFTHISGADASEKLICNPLFT